MEDLAGTLVTSFFWTKAKGEMLCEKKRALLRPLPSWIMEDRNEMIELSTVVLSKDDDDDTDEKDDEEGPDAFPS